MRRISRSVMALVIVWAAFLVWVILAYVAARDIERPAYVVLQRSDGYEVRQYPPYLVAQVVQKGPRDASLREGSHSLMAYLNGSNATQLSFEATVSDTAATIPTSELMTVTAPLVEETRGDSHLVSVIIPSHYTQATIPRPNNPEIRLVSVASASVAVLTFNGSADADGVARQEIHLRNLLMRDKRSILSPVRLVRYSPAWAPAFLRKNEIMFTVR